MIIYSGGHQYIKTVRRTNPTAELITLEEIKRHLRVDDDFSDLELTGMIDAARDQIETFTGRYWLPCRITSFYTCFPYRSIELQFPDVASVDEIKYYDQNDSLVLLSNSPVLYTLDADRLLVNIPLTSQWPIGYRVEVSMTLAASLVPPSVRLAALMLVTDMFEHRGAQEVSAIFYANPAVANLLNPYRWRRHL